ncbi:hypothetical protein Q4R57_21465, partial [Morganella morganii]
TRRLDPDPGLVADDIGDQDPDAAFAQLPNQFLRRVVGLEGQGDAFAFSAGEYQETHVPRPCQS